MKVNQTVTRMCRENVWTVPAFESKVFPGPQTRRATQQSTSAVRRGAARAASPTGAPGGTAGAAAVGSRGRRGRRWGAAETLGGGTGPSCFLDHRIFLSPHFPGPRENLWSNPLGKSPGVCLWGSPPRHLRRPMPRPPQAPRRGGRSAGRPTGRRSPGSAHSAPGTGGGPSRGGAAPGGGGCDSWGGDEDPIGETRAWANAPLPPVAESMGHRRMSPQTIEPPRHIPSPRGYEGW